MNRFPSKANALQFLRDIGVEIGTVLDVGAHEQTIDLREVFPDRRHLLFEPAVEFAPKIADNYATMDYELLSVAVSNADSEASLRKFRITGDQISHSTLVFGESTADLIRVPTVRLDTVLQARQDPGPYLLKVDVDGLELVILEGAAGIWDDVACIVIEATCDSFAERVNFITSRGFRIFDIVDQCYYDGVFAQADIVFLADRLYDEIPRLRALNAGGFEWRKWFNVASMESAATGSVPPPVPPPAPAPARVLDGFAAQAAAAAAEAGAAAEVAARAGTISLIEKQAAIDACLRNPWQPSLVWQPGFFGSMLQIDLREQVSQEIFLTGVTEPSVVDFLSWALEPGMSVYDVGSHIGFLSIVAAHMVGPQGRVRAFEPSPTTRLHLETNLRNAAMPWAAADSRAAWSGPATLRLNDFGPAFSAYASVCGIRLPPERARPPLGSVEVEAVALDAVAAAEDRPPDLVKIDVESAEHAVLAGMTGLLTGARPVIVLELGDFPHLIAEGVPPSRDLLTLLERAGYTLHELVPGGLVAHRIRDGADYPYQNVACVPSEKLFALKARQVRR